MIYMGDMIIEGDDMEEISNEESGGLIYFQRVLVSVSKQGIFLSWRKYVLDLLYEVDMIDCELEDTLIIRN